MLGTCPRRVHRSQIVLLLALMAVHFLENVAALSTLFTILSTVTKSEAIAVEVGFLGTNPPYLASKSQRVGYLIGDLFGIRLIASKKKNCRGSRSLLIPTRDRGRGELSTSLLFRPSPALASPCLAVGSPAFSARFGSPGDVFALPW
jgi:hypothetical protein